MHTGKQSHETQTKPLTAMPATDLLTHTLFSFVYCFLYTYTNLCIRILYFTRDLFLHEPLIISASSAKKITFAGSIFF